MNEYIKKWLLLLQQNKKKAAVLGGALLFVCLLGGGLYMRQKENRMKELRVSGMASPSEPSRETVPAATAASPSEALSAEEERARLLLAGINREGGAPDSPSDSAAALLYTRLAEKDSQWLSGIYGLYDRAPADLAAQLGLSDLAGQLLAQEITAFSSLNVSFYNGENTLIQGVSNARAIISLTDTMYQRGSFSSYEEIEAFADWLWEQSHSWSAALGELYYCEGGCAVEAPSAEAVPSEAASIPPEASGSEPEMATPSQVTDTGTVWGPEGGPGIVPETISEPLPATASPSEAAAGAPICRGHIDLAVTAFIKDTGINGLFSLPLKDETLPDWSEEERGQVQELLSQDWYEAYGINAADLVSVNPLTSAEIELYMKLIPPETSELRRRLIQYGLASVGRIPYYWGGKPHRPGYEGNGFGTVVEPDVDGRFLKGLDCSGWISWLYWSVTGSRLGAESTGNLIQTGQVISKEELLPGDLCIRTGSMAHVVLFLGWAENGQMLCIQETSGLTNNVEASLSDEDWPYYRRILPAGQ